MELSGRTASTVTTIKINSAALIFRSSLRFILRPDTLFRVQRILLLAREELVRTNKKNDRPYRAHCLAGHDWYVSSRCSVCSYTQYLTEDV